MATAQTTGVPIAGDKLVLKRNASGQARLLFLSRDPVIPLPGEAVLDDGMTLEVFALDVDPDTGDFRHYARLLATQRMWRHRVGRSEAFRFGPRMFPSRRETKTVLVKRDGERMTLRWVGMDPGIEMDDALGSVGILARYDVDGRDHVICALFAPSSIKVDRPGKFVAEGALRPENCDFRFPAAPPPGECGVEDTFQVIQERIFDARGCTTATCHGAFTTNGLDLRPGSSHVSLVDVAATNASAAASGKKRVVPGDPAASFLSQKLRGQLGPDEGTAMPSVGRVLNTTELDLIDAWITAGAPQAGEVEVAPCLHHEENEPADPLLPPPGGYQIVLTGPTLQPGQEEEGCLWVAAPNDVDFLTGKWEFSLNPGTHHFAVFEWNKDGPPVTGRWNRGDFGCFSGAEFGNSIAGSPHAPYYVEAYPAGVARLLRAGSYLGLNAHYYNEFHDPLDVKVWINIHPYEGPPPKLAQSIVDVDDTFAIAILPFTVGLFPPDGAPRARWTNTSDSTWSVINVGGHMHNRGLRFTAWSADGSKLYETFNWAHPNQRYFTPTLDLPPGGHIDYECAYDNGVDRPVREDTAGNPATLVFGVSAEDAMCILTGQYYGQ